MPAGKHIVFDWNCTLFNDIHALHECTNRLLAIEGHEPVSIENFRSCYHIPFDQFYRNLGFNEAQIEGLMGLENSAFHENYEPLAATAGLREGAAEILSNARTRGVKTYILSNHIVDSIRMQLKRLKIEHYFTEVLAYASRATQFRDMTKGERLRRYRGKCGIAPQDMIIVGDSIEEIQIAHAQDLISIALTGGCASEQRLRAEKPDYVIHSLHDLQPILEERGFVS